MARPFEVRAGFSADEVKVLDWILTNLQRGSLGSRGQPVVRRPEFVTLAQKISAMKVAHDERSRDVEETQ